jgi:hypothetical protein
MYVNLFFIIFDIHEVADCHGEDNRIVDGIVMPVAAGPRPRLLFCPPAYAQLHYVGDEWVFVMYRPFCKWWVSRINHVLPNV